MTRATTNPATSLLLLVMIIAVTVYWPGLDGPFLFDDAPHIVKNTQVHITDLSAASLSRAWSSSLAVGLGSRPLAQLTFGINHALGGLDAWWFKAINLAIHLLSGLLLFVLTRELGRCLVRERATDSSTATWAALFATAIWLLHPLNLTPVLYVVQRMTSLSALFIIAALWCHVRGRRAMSEGHGAGFWLALAGWPLALIGGLAKESAALYPVFVLVLEWTLLRNLTAPRRGLLVGIVAGLPLLVGGLYLATHLGLLNHAGREFSLVERLMTEARVLWLYLQMLFWPDLSVLGFYHDDIQISRGLTTPWSTLAAIAAWIGVTLGAVLGARRWPVVSFGVLFFLAGHLMESTVFPLELVFEHRNYLPVLGPIFAVSWLLVRCPPASIRRWVSLLAVALVLVLAALTHLRAQDWGDQERLLLREVSHHPNSPRVQFRVAQLYIGRLQSGSGTPADYRAARDHLTRLISLAPDNVDALFGLLFLQLSVNQDPPQALLDRLVDRLRHGVVDPTKLSVGQFSYLVKWQMADGHKLDHQQALRILEAVLDNPRMNRQGKAGVLSALRAYHDRVLNDPEAALPYAQQAVKTWSARWHYHYRLVEILLKLGRLEEARSAFRIASELPSAELNRKQVDELASAIEQAQNTSHD